MRKVVTRRRFGGRQLVPVAYRSRGAPHVDLSKRIVPLDPLFDTRMPHNERTKCDEEHERDYQGEPRETLGQHPNEEPGGGQKGREPEPRDQTRPARILVAPRRMRRRILFIRNR